MQMTDIHCNLAILLVI